VKKKDMPNSMIYLDIETKKSMHIDLPRKDHSKLRIMAIQNKVSMQEIMRGVITEIVEETPYMMRLLKKIVVNKRKQQISDLKLDDVDSVFDVLEEYNPFDGDED